MELGENDGIAVGEVDVSIEERVEEREVAKIHDLEEDCGERMEHSRLDEQEYAGQRIGQTAWRP